EPEPDRENRAAVRRAMAAADADIAVGYDPDADRMYAVHPDLGWLGGDRLFYLLARIVEPDRVVASIDTSPLIEEIDADISYTRVGDVFVAAEGVAAGADLLGEPNGHYAVPAFCWYNSGIVASALIAAHADGIADMLAPVSEYTTERRVAVYGSMAERDAALSEAKKQVAKRFEVVSTVDGMKFEAGEVTGLVRPSGTSPKIRLVLHGTGDIGDRADEIRDAVL
ncbi:MAG: hypothetical protein ABEK12_00065, partial [Candidatus Nanohaloarchaea archaeon]